MQIYPTPQDRKTLPSRGIKGSTPTWMDEKRVRDAQLSQTDTTNGWIIEGNLYNLTPFISLHPGGPEWLKLTIGQDITELFIIHHLNQDKARESLKKYYVGPCNSNLSSTRTTFHQNGLYRIMKRKLLSQFTIKEIQDETKSKTNAWIILAAFLLSLFIAGYFESYLLCAVPGLLCVSMFGVGHNFIHHKTNNFKYFFLPTGFSYTQVQIMHCISHHIYPNMELDYEAATLEPIVYFLRSRPANQFYTEALVFLLFIVLQPVSLLLKLIIIPLKRKVRPDTFYLGPLAVFCLFWLLTRDCIIALKMHCLVFALFGVFFTRIVFCGHRKQEMWTEGSERYDDFGEHTIRTTADTDVWIRGFASLLLLAGFNIHTPHHFFPTADHSFLPRIFPMIVEACNNSKVKHNVGNRLECAISGSRGLVRRIPYRKE